MSMIETINLTKKYGELVALDNLAEDGPAPAGAGGTLISSLADLSGGGGQNNITDPDSGALAA